MKSVFGRNRIVPGILLASAVLLAVNAFAANKGSFELMHPTQVGDTQLAPGSYRLEWKGSGDQVHVDILQHNKPVASTSARVVPVKSASPFDTALVTVNPDGTRSLAEILLQGKKFALQVTNEAGGSGGASAGAR